MTKKEKMTKFLQAQMRRQKELCLIPRKKRTKRQQDEFRKLNLELYARFLTGNRSADLMPLFDENWRFESIDLDSAHPTIGMACQDDYGVDHDNAATFSTRRSEENIKRCMIKMDKRGRKKQRGVV